MRGIQLILWIVYVSVSHHLPGDERDAKISMFIK